MSHAVGGLAIAVVLAPGRGERCQITDNADVALRLNVGLATGDTGRARAGRRDELSAPPEWLEEAAAVD